MKIAPFLLCSLYLLLVAGADAPKPQQWSIPRSEYTQRNAGLDKLRLKLNTENPQRFAAQVFKSAGGELPYRLFTPAKHEGKLPLVLVLHGSSGRGTDNLAHLTGQNVCVTTGIWTLAEHQEKHPCYVLAPQCPPEPAAWTMTKDWTARSQPHSPEPAPVMVQVIALLDEVVKQHPVDVSRIYLAGASMGGFGVWDLLVRHPARFAAAVTVSGGLADGQAAGIARVPVWIFHGGNDETVPVELSRNAFRLLSEAGGAPRYTEFAEGEHRISVYAWTQPGLGDWVFAQQLPGGMPK